MVYNGLQWFIQRFSFFNGLYSNGYNLDFFMVYNGLLNGTLYRVWCDYYDYFLGFPELGVNVNPGSIKTKRLFHLEGAIKKYHIMNIAGIPP